MVRNTSSIYYRRIIQPITRLDGKEARQVIQQIVDDIDQAQRSWSLNRIHAGLAGSSS
jgi:hypothetical protein